MQIRMTRLRLFPAALLVLLLAACDAGIGSVASVPAPSTEAQPTPSTEKDPPRPWIGERTAISRWAVAENKAKCAPLALVDDGGAKGAERPAEFAGGWAVAFDQTGLRSAYGFAGVGLLDGDEQPLDEHRRRLAAQWPHMIALDRNLPTGSFAGYGLVGAQPYSDGNPDGRGEESLAYLRIAGETCMYNVWSRLGRAHLLTVLNGLRVLRPAP